MALGRLYYAYVATSTTAFDPAAHAREDEAVLALTISHREGQFPHALLAIVNPGVPLVAPGRNKYVWLSIDKDGMAHPLFFGRITGWPRAAGKPGTIEVEIVAQPDQWRTALGSAAAGVRRAPYWDELFVAPERLLEPEETLEGYPGHFHWSRTGGGCVVSDLLQGRTTLALGTNWLDGSLRFDVSQPPLRRVECTLSAEWVQRVAGTVDVTSDIQAALGSLTISTMTGDDLARSWSKVGDTISSGYTVASTSLTDIDLVYSGRRLFTIDGVDFVFEIPAAYRPDDAYIQKFAVWASPAAAPPLDVNATPAQQAAPQQVNLRVWRLTPSLVLSYRAEQARREVVTFTLASDVQDIAFDDGGYATLRWQLNDPTRDTTTPEFVPYVSYAVGDQVLVNGTRYICNVAYTAGEFFNDGVGHWVAQALDQSALGTPTRAGFFHTDRGLASIDHAMSRARAVLARAARCAEIQVRMPVEPMLDIDCDTSCTLAGGDLPGGGATGKVVGYTLTFDGEGRSGAEIVLGASVGTGTVYTIPAGAPEYVTTDYVGGDYQDLTGTERAVNDGATWLGIAYAIGDGNPTYLRPGLRHATLTNGAADQQAYLLANQYPAVDDPRQLLGQVPTQLALALRPLAGNPLIEAKMGLTLTFPWAPPRHVSVD